MPDLPSKTRTPFVCNLLNRPILLALISCLAALGSTRYATTCAADDQLKTDAQTKVYSGPQKGEKTKPFKVLHVNNDEFQDATVLAQESKGVDLVCFVHKLSNDDRILYGLGLVDFYAARHKKLTSNFVLLMEKNDKMSNMLRAWNKGNLFRNTRVSLSADGVEGPGFYGLNRNVAMTVLVIKDNAVVDNLVFNAPNYRDLESIMVSVANALGESKPTLAGVQQELKAQRQRELEKRIKASPSFKLAPHEDLGKIMYGLVNSRGNRAKNAERRTKMLLDWVGDSKQRRSQLAKYCQAILDGDFQLDQFARAALKKLAATKDSEAKGSD